MNRYAILVDAGYLLRQSVEILSGKSSKTRADLVLADAKGLVQLLIAKAADSLQNTNLLRVYWYDGIKDSMTAEHKAIIAVEDVQFRAGTINGKGQQKGVDSRIVTDLVELAHPCQSEGPSSSNHHCHRDGVGLGCSRRRFFFCSSGSCCTCSCRRHCGPVADSQNGCKGNGGHRGRCRCFHQQTNHSIRQVCCVEHW